MKIQKKALQFNEAQLLKGLTVKKAHADEIIDIYRLPDYFDVPVLDFEPARKIQNKKIVQIK